MSGTMGGCIVTSSSTNIFAGIKRDYDADRGGEKSEDFFNKWQFPNYVGAIDGKQSQNDGGVWANSAFGQAIDAGEIDFPFPKEIPGSDVIFPFTFIADEAFPLCIHMMRPYARTYRTFGNKERIFNYRLSRARRTIENAFGIISSRWHILRRDLCCTPEATEDIVKIIMTGEEIYTGDRLLMMVDLDPTIPQ
ncbi:hypothetical protein ACFW04_013764 [Cataglyphis niger]